MARDLPPHRVLVADDDPDVLAVAAATLSTTGAEVAVALDGPAALAAIATSVPDVLVTDIVMPGMDGFALATAVVAEHPTVAIVLATGQPDDVVRARATALEWPLLVKPYSPTDLRDAVAEALTRGGPR